RRALARIAEGDTLRTQVAVLRRFLKRVPIDTIALKRRVADRALELSRYPFAKQQSCSVVTPESRLRFARSREGKQWQAVTLHRSEGTAMFRAGAILHEAIKMFRSAVPFVARQDILRVEAIQIAHVSV